MENRSREKWGETWIQSYTSRQGKQQHYQTARVLRHNVLARCLNTDWHQECEIFDTEGQLELGKRLKSFLVLHIYKESNFVLSFQQ